MGATRLVSLIAGALLIVAGFSAFFTVNQTQQALVLQLGDPKRTIQEPGLAFKLPFIQDVTYYEKRVLSLIPQDAQEVILSDQKRLMVDAYARYKITDPLLFYQTVRNENGARGRLEAIIDSSVRRALGNETLGSILTGQRNDITRSIGDEVNQSVVSLGLQIIDVRLRRADYPDATSQNIFNRMKSERTREAKEFRATGEEEAQKIRSAAEKTRTVIISEAQQIAQETRGGGDSEAIRIYADSFGQDAEFFAFYRSMEHIGSLLVRATLQWCCHQIARFSDTSLTRMVVPKNSRFYQARRKIRAGPAS